MEEKENSIVCIACGVFTQELQVLKKDRRLDMELRFLQSELHMDPQTLRQELEAEVKQQLAQGRKVILLYGDCQTPVLCY